MEDSKKNIKKFLEEQDSDKIARAAKGAGAQGGEKTETTEKSEKPIDTDKEKKREELEKLKDEEKKAQEEKKRLEEKRAQDAQKLTETNIGIMTAKKKAEEKEKEKGPVRETLEEKVEQKTKKPTGKKVKTSKAGSPDQPKADLGKKGEIPQTLTSALGQYQAGRLFALGYSEWQIKRMSPYEIKRILSRRQKTSEKKPVAPVPEKVGNEKDGKESKKETLKSDWTEEDEKTLNNLLAVIENAQKTIENAKKRMTEIDAEIERVKKEEEQAVISEPENKESKKEEIEKRRQEELRLPDRREWENRVIALLAKYEDASYGGWGKTSAYPDMGTLLSILSDSEKIPNEIRIKECRTGSAIIRVIHGKTGRYETNIKEINAKYDAELAALEKQEENKPEKQKESKGEEGIEENEYEIKKADIEKRREEEINKPIYGENRDISVLQNLKNSRKKIEEYKFSQKQIEDSNSLKLTYATNGHYKLIITNNKNEKIDISYTNSIYTDIYFKNTGHIIKNIHDLTIDDIKYLKNDILQKVKKDVDREVNWMNDFQNKINEINAKYDAEIERVKKEEEQAVISEPENKESKKEEPATEQKTETEEQTKLEDKEKEIKSYSVEFIKTKILPLLQNIKQIDEVKSLDIKGGDKEITINTTIKSFGFNITVQATLENKEDGIVVKNYKVDASWLVKGKAQKAIEPHLNKISKLLKSYIEKEENRKIEKIWIENGELKAL